MSTELVMPSNYLIFCHPLLLPSIFPSIRVFSSESVLPIRWPKYQSFSFSISPSNVYSGLISFRIDWFDLLAVQVALKSLLQHHSWRYQFFGTQPFLLYSSWFLAVKFQGPEQTWMVGHSAQNSPELLINLQSSQLRWVYLSQISVSPVSSTWGHTACRKSTTNFLF